MSRTVGRIFSLCGCDLFLVLLHADLKNAAPREKLRLVGNARLLVLRLPQNTL